MLMMLSKKLKPPEHAHLVGHVQLLGAVEVEHAVEVGRVAVEVELVVLQAVPVVEVKNYDKSHVFDSHLCIIVQFLRVCKFKNIFMGSSPCESSKSGERLP